jgi:hypothetical protein
MIAKRGQRVVLKMGLKPFFADPVVEAAQRFQPGDDGTVISRTKNGWLRVRIARTAWVITVRNGPTRIDHPFKRNQKWTKCGYQPPSFAWWVPLTETTTPRYLPPHEDEADIIVRRLKALAIPSTPETQCYKCGCLGHWSSECQKQEQQTDWLLVEG